MADINSRKFAYKYNWSYRLSTLAYCNGIHNETRNHRSPIKYGSSNIIAYPALIFRHVNHFHTCFKSI